MFNSIKGYFYYVFGIMTSFLDIFVQAPNGHNMKTKQNKTKQNKTKQNKTKLHYPV
jgi:hypothetical protein